MGNYFARSKSRQTICALLNRFPDWFFGGTRRIAVNQAVLKLRQEMANSGDDWDSALDFSLDSTQTVDEDYVRIASTSARGSSRASRRTSCCRSHSKTNQQLETLQEELRSLREDIAKLLASGREEKGIDVEIPAKENSFTVPVPPPLPTHLCATPVKETSTEVEKSDDKLNMTSVLKDLTNVKLRSVGKTPGLRKGKEREITDVRNDLYEILKKRYAAMHSPMRKYRNSEEHEKENSFLDTSLHFQRQTVMMAI